VAGPTGTSGPLTAPIQQSTLLGTIGTSSSFLTSSTGSSTSSSGSSTTTTDSQGNHGQSGEHLGQLFAGGQLTTDLTSIAGLAGVGTGGSSQGVGADTQHSTGVGAAFTAPDGSNTFVQRPNDHADGGAGSSH
jgi:hypothetical protein